MTKIASTLFSSLNFSKYARTTDVKPKELQSIDDNLHLNKDFEILYTEIKKHILE